MIVGSPLLTIAMDEFVVPRSMPTIRLISRLESTSQRIRVQAAGASHHTDAQTCVPCYVENRAPGFRYTIRVIRKTPLASAVASCVRFARRDRAHVRRGR